MRTNDLQLETGKRYWTRGGPGHKPELRPEIQAIEKPEDNDGMDYAECTDGRRYYSARGRYLGYDHDESAAHLDLVEERIDRLERLTLFLVERDARITAAHGYT
jgi:hypothetical protein